MTKVWLLIAILCGGAVMVSQPVAAASIEVPKFADKVNVKTEANRIGGGFAVFLYVLAGIVAVFGVIVGGIKIADSKAEDGWQTIKNALMGSGVVVFSGAIVHVFS